MQFCGKPCYELVEDAHSHDLKCPSLSMLHCPNIAYQRMNYCMIVGVSNGLVLYVHNTMGRRGQIYNIYNPITLQWISLPPYVRYFERQESSLVTRFENGVLSSYRVVRVELRTGRTNVIKFDVFLSETKEWKGFDVYTDTAFEGMRSGRPATELNEILHWLTKGRGIMTYDSYQNPDSVRFIALPDPTCHQQMLNLCDAHLGSLRYFQVCDSETGDPPHGFSSFSVWILSDYSTGDWCLQHRIRSTAIIYDDLLLGKYLVPRPIYFHPFDPDIVFLRYQNIIVSYNFKTRKLEARIIDLAGGMLTPPRYWPFFLLVFPPWPPSINL